MIVGPCVGYILQTRLMIKTKSPDSFSTYVSFIVIVSNILRVFWWQVEHFSYVIVSAALLMIAC